MTKYNEETRLRSIYNQSKMVNGCLEYQGSLDVGGYAFISWNYKLWKGHRLVWFLEKKQMPKKLILHKCDNRKCVNIDHLYEGNHKDNMADQLARNRHHKASRTKCREGHLFEGDNVMMGVSKIGTPFRRCRECTMFLQRVRRNNAKALAGKVAEGDV